MILPHPSPKTNMTQRPSGSDEGREKGEYRYQAISFLFMESMTGEKGYAYRGEKAGILSSNILGQGWWNGSGLDDR